MTWTHCRATFKYRKPQIFAANVALEFGLKIASANHSDWCEDDPRDDHERAV